MARENKQSLRIGFVISVIGTLIAFFGTSIGIMNSSGIGWSYGGYILLFGSIPICLMGLIVSSIILWKKQKIDDRKEYFVGIILGISLGIGIGMVSMFIWFFW